jgi:acetylornithine deacetylase/succinyl-diaminopimelate desuccinylase-like protein
VTLLITTDEETTKQGARRIRDSALMARIGPPRGILVVESTGMRPIRGHRSHVGFTATAHGVQAHSSSAEGRNANWQLIPFLAEMRTLFQTLRDDPAWHDPAYDPPFSDFNLVVDNHGTAINVTVPVATARIKFRYSRRIDPGPVRDLVQAAADRAGIDLHVQAEGAPPELPPDHPFVRQVEAQTGQPAGTAPYGTDASELQDLAPCVVCGPGSIAAAHTPWERVRVAELADAVPVFLRLVQAVGRGSG